MLEQHDNSIIFDDVNKYSVIDYSHLNYNDFPEDEIIINQNNHSFKKGDVLYFDVKNNNYYKAIANNTIMSEAIGIVSETKLNSFKLKIHGTINNIYNTNQEIQDIINNIKSTIY